MIRFAFKILKNEESAREITQEAFVKLWNKFDQDKDKGHESPWLYTAVRNACYDVLRKSKKFHLSADDCLEIENELGGDHDWIDGQVWSGTVPSLAFDQNLDRVDIGHRQTFGEVDVARFQ